MDCEFNTAIDCKKCNPKAAMGTVSCQNAGMFQHPIPCECPDEQLFIVKGACSQSKVEILLTSTNERKWTQLFVPEVLCIPCPKPDIEQLLSVSSIVQILSTRIIRTPVLKDSSGNPITIRNQEGLFTTGRKLVIEGLLRQKVVYVAALPEQSVHSAHFDVPFSAFIILENNEPLTRKYTIEACIEDIFITQITARQIFKNVTLFLKATPLVC